MLSEKNWETYNKLTWTYGGFRGSNSHRSALVGKGGYNAHMCIIKDDNKETMDNIKSLMQSLMKIHKDDFNANEFPQYIPPHYLLEFIDIDYDVSDEVVWFIMEQLGELLNCDPEDSCVILRNRKSSKVHIVINASYGAVNIIHDNYEYHLDFMAGLVADFPLDDKSFMMDDVDVELYAKLQKLSDVGDVNGCFVKATRVSKLTNKSYDSKDQCYVGQGEDDDGKIDTYRQYVDEPLIKWPENGARPHPYLPTCMSSTLTIDIRPIIKARSYALKSWLRQAVWNQFGDTQGFPSKHEWVSKIFDINAKGLRCANSVKIKSIGTGKNKKPQVASRDTYGIYIIRDGEGSFLYDTPNDDQKIEEIMMSSIYRAATQRWAPKANYVISKSLPHIIRSMIAPTSMLADDYDKKTRMLDTRSNDVKPNSKGFKLEDGTTKLYVDRALIGDLIAALPVYHARGRGNWFRVIKRVKLAASVLEHEFDPTYLLHGWSREHALAGDYDEHKNNQIYDELDISKEEITPGQAITWLYAESKYKKLHAITKESFDLLAAHINKPFKERRIDLQNCQIEVYEDASVKMLSHDLPTQVVHAGKGLGKTKMLAQFISEMPADAVIIYVSFRQTFTSHIAKTFDGFVDYRNIRGNICQLDENKRLVIQIESLHRLRVDWLLGHGQAIDLFVLDESESNLAQFASPFHGHKLSQNWAVFRRCLESAKQVIAMDANISDRTMSLLRVRESIAPVHYYRNKKTINMCDVHLTSDDGVFKTELFKAIHYGKKIVIPTNSKTQADALQQMINCEYPNITVINYTSETNPTDRNNDIANLAERWKTANVLIYTSTITAGVSFEEIHFDELFAYFRSESAPAEDCDQMLARVRNIGCKKMTMFIDKRRSAAYATLGQIKYAYKNMHLHIKDHDPFIIHHTMVASTIGADGSHEPTDPLFFEMWAHNELARNHSKADIAKEIVYMLKNAGHNTILLESDKDQTIIDEFYDHKMAIKDKHIAMVASAAALEEFEAKTIEEKIRCDMNISKEERASIQQYRLRRLYMIHKETQLTGEAVAKMADQNAMKVFKTMKHMLMTKTIVGNDQPQHLDYHYQTGGITSYKTIWRYDDEDVEFAPEDVSRTVITVATSKTFDGLRAIEKYRVFDNEHMATLAGVDRIAYRPHYPIHKLAYDLLVVLGFGNASFMSSIVLTRIQIIANISKHRERFIALYHEAKSLLQLRGTCPQFNSGTLKQSLEFINSVIGRLYGRKVFIIPIVPKHVNDDDAVLIKDTVLGDRLEHVLIEHVKPAETPATPVTPSSPAKPINMPSVSSFEEPKTVDELLQRIYDQFGCKMSSDTLHTLAKGQTNIIVKRCDVRQWLKDKKACGAL